MKMKSHPHSSSGAEQGDGHHVFKGSRTPYKRRPSSIISDPSMSYATPADLDVLSEAQEVSSSTYLARIRRATRSRYLGYDSQSYINNITFNNNNNNNNEVSTPQGLKAAASPIMEEGSIEYDATKEFCRRFEHVEGKKRLAQDSLLLKELELGILPEHLLKKLPHMKHITTLDLSHYGIGDKLCMCLGLRSVIIYYSLLYTQI